MKKRNEGHERRMMTPGRKKGAAGSKIRKCKWTIKDGESGGRERERERGKEESTEVARIKKISV